MRKDNPQKKKKIREQRWDLENLVISVLWSARDSQYWRNLLKRNKFEPVRIHKFQRTFLEVSFAWQILKLDSNLLVFWFRSCLSYLNAQICQIIGISICFDVELIKSNFFRRLKTNWNQELNEIREIREIEKKFSWHNVIKSHKIIFTTCYSWTRIPYSLV